jgi:hypothetical protein
MEGSVVNGDFGGAIDDLRKEFRGILDTCATHGESIAVLKERLHRFETNITDIKATLARLEGKWDERFSKAASDTVKMDKRLSTLLVKVGVVWALLNGAMLVVAGVVIKNVLT